MKNNLRYLWYVLRHKWHVFVECCKLGIPWRGLVHDLSKFSRAEWGPYVRNFYGGPYLKASEVWKRLPGYSGPTKEDVERDFNLAWLHHQKRNKHHWQYWILQYDAGETWRIQSMGDGYQLILSEGTEHYLGIDAIGIENEDKYHLDYVRLQRIVDLLNLTPARLPMPDVHRREMLADWRGASKAFDGKDDTVKWYAGNKDKMHLHPSTRKWIEAQLCES